MQEGPSEKASFPTVPFVQCTGQGSAGKLGMCVPSIFHDHPKLLLKKDCFLCIFFYSHAHGLMEFPPGKREAADENLPAKD